MEQTDPRTWRRDPASESAGFTDLATSPFRIDRDRIAASPFFARLGGVTQVVSAGGSGLLHNRLTHSLKVAQVARAIAERINSASDSAELAAKLGGCDPDVAEAASLAHDLGHPPFGHLGEQTLDRIARHRFGLADGFEGNAQSFRIITTTDVRGPSASGLDLTTAVRAAVLKYPWARLHVPDPHPTSMPVQPRGAAEPADAPGTGASKFSAYSTELDDFTHARAPFDGRIEPWQQTVEASVMDTADDIAYAIHDLQDFHRIGVLQHAPVAAEFTGWVDHAVALAALDDATLTAERRLPGRSLERLRRRMHAKDGWIVDDDAFTSAVVRVRAELVDGLLATGFDGSIEAEQATAAFSAKWTARLVDGVQVVASPSTRTGHLTLRPAQWHEVQVLKFVHRQFVLLRPELALHQRGQASLVTTLVDALDAWLLDRDEFYRLPRRLHDLVELARSEFSALARTSPELLVGATGEPVTGADAVRGLARGRAVVDFVASLTDKQAVTLLDGLSGRASQPWSDSFVL
ncbi:deoxyguanosinetriphosphate triphosphohydrolase family protein [Amycolatopsis sp. EV170708-02-1]|uniref:deoxyguanosinetriphosphate triphosphohydrolase family protein n=1 Tax=Amycolatopsis sp. EV170708-02-1 TaxID=2919322 RepID=UPI001F0CB985|nr:dNTP triphosphohydrolase [Amycolatopsis sp. EV170708-02-1]UMP03782.1 dNTP triphosphohydrolase [Amycolatopsis sp. EV170708-02-1]